MASSITSLFLRYGSGKCLMDRVGRIKSRLPNLNTVSFGECGLSQLTDFNKEKINICLAVSFCFRHKFRSNIWEINSFLS